MRSPSSAPQPHPSVPHLPESAVSFPPPLLWSVNPLGVPQPLCFWGQTKPGTFSDWNSWTSGRYPALGSLRVLDSCSGVAVRRKAQASGAETLQLGLNWGSLGKDLQFHPPCVALTPMPTLPMEVTRSQPPHLSPLFTHLHFSLRSLCVPLTTGHLPLLQVFHLV